MFGGMIAAMPQRCAPPLFRCRSAAWRRLAEMCSATVNPEHALRAAGRGCFARLREQPPKRRVLRRLPRGKSPQGVRAMPCDDNREKSVNDRPTGTLMYNRSADQFALLRYGFQMRLFFFRCVMRPDVNVIALLPAT